MIKKFAFTLAEVLITLGIIGVVAAITIPTVMSKVQDAQFKTAFKKEFSLVDQATRSIASDNGGSVVGLFKSTCSTAYDTDNMRLYFQQYFKTVDQCTVLTSCNLTTELGPTNAGACSAKYCEYVQNIKMADNTISDQYEVGRCGTNPQNVLFLADGTILIFGGGWGFANLGSVGSTCNGVANGYNNICDSVLIDVNGFKNPNKFGKDIFHIWVLSNRAAPTIAESSGSYFQCDTNSNTTGYGCASKILTGIDYNIP